MLVADIDPERRTGDNGLSPICAHMRCREENLLLETPEVRRDVHDELGRQTVRGLVRVPQRPGGQQAFSKIRFELIDLG